jgi:hypothetical protein
VPLSSLRPAPDRPALLATFDQDDWVALLLEGIPGRHPDLGDPSDYRAIDVLVTAQVCAGSPAIELAIRRQPPIYFRTPLRRRSQTMEPPWIRPGRPALRAACGR